MGHLATNKHPESPLMSTLSGVCERVVIGAFRGMNVESAVLFLAERRLSDTLHFLKSEAFRGNLAGKFFQASINDTQRRGSIPSVCLR